MNYVRQLAVIGVMALLPWQAMAADTPAASNAPAAVSQDSAKGENHEDRMWKKMDPQGKGYVTKDEWIKHSEEKFKEIDANGDGKISKEEMHAYHEKMRQKFAGRHHRHEQGQDDGKQS